MSAPYGEDEAETVVLCKQQRRKQFKIVFPIMDPLASAGKIQNEMILRL